MLTLSAPLLFALELTPACNSLCPVCSNVFTRQTVSLSASDWRQILEQIAPYAEVLKITGGEPTLHPEFAEIIQTIAEKNIPFTLFTNGRWRKPKAVIDLLKPIPQFKGLLISLHGPDASSHEGFTHTGYSFEDTCKNIRRATAAGLRVHTSTVLTRYNWNRVWEMVILSQKLGAKRAVFNRYLGPPMPDIEPEDWQLRAAIRAIEALICQMDNRQSSSRTISYGNCIPQCLEPSSSTGCLAGVAYCTIDPWGNLRPCNHSPTVAGNILDESIEKIWQNEIMNRWRALLPEQCGTCTQFSLCHGGCRALVEIRQQDPLIRWPIHEKRSQPPVKLDLYEKYRPRLDCKVLPEPFGHVLVRGHAIVTVTHRAKAILDALDGYTTLYQLQDKFGQEAVNFVGSLYLKRLVSLRAPYSP